MSRPDWGALQQEYIAEYTRSGISPVAWCEARGLNYATARRYIKKTPKNAQTEMCKTAQKSAQKKSAQTAQKRNEKSQEKKPVFDAGLNEGDAEEFSFCPDEFGISDQQAKFAMLVAQGKKPTEAYRLAGYEGQGATANSNASRMLRNARVFRAISYFRNQYQKRYTADLDLLVSQLMAIVLADPNQLAQFRRVNCRYCWGENHLYQWRDIAEFDKAAAQASRDGKPEPEYGGLGFVDNAISRYSTGVAARMVKILNDSDAELTARLLIALDSLDPGNFTVKRLESLLASVRKVNRTAINSMFTSLSGELNELAIYEAGYQLSLFDSMLPDFVADVHPLVGISPDALYAAAMARPFQGRLLSEWASDLEADRLRRITNTVRQGFLLGDTNEQIARKIRGHVSKGFQDGALQMSRANAASIAKTAVGHLAATARESFASANNDLIKGKQWLSTLDNRTTPQCRIRDRLKYTLNNKPVGHSVPYLQGPGKIHFCCRSTETFILKSAKELGIDVRDISPAERASMDGVVAGDTTYREWFLRQPYTRQKQIVGETRAKLIRDGGMSPDEFYTDKGEWLTLKQLRERDAQVFRKAGI